MNELGTTDWFEATSDLDRFGEDLPDIFDYVEYDTEFNPVHDDFDEDLFGDSEGLVDALGQILNEDYGDASHEELQNVFDSIQATMTAAEAFNFRKALRGINKAGQGILKNPVVGQIAQTALPVAGGALGTMIGGPVGTALGAQLGQAAGSAFKTGKPPKKAGPFRMRPVRSVSKPYSPQAGSTAATQLLQLTQNPQVLQSLVALALGPQARQSVPLASGTAVPAGAFMNLLSGLATKAAEDADELSGVSAEASDYLMDGDGEVSMDASVPENRASALYELLLNDEEVRLELEAQYYLDELDLDDEFY